MIAGANEKLLKALTTYAEGIGLAFQIIDDILDLTSSSEKLGKTAGKDLLADKTTYPKLLGMEESKKRAFDLVEKAKKAIEPWGEDAKYLISLADFIIQIETDNYFNLCLSFFPFLIIQFFSGAYYPVC